MALHRHQLLRLSADGWAGVLREPRDDEARRCFTLWAGADRPLVVTRQADPDATRLALGLPAPTAFGRRRLALAVDAAHVAPASPFPAAEEVTALLPAAARPAWRALVAGLAAVDCAARVYGGHGWQHLTGLAYLHDASDIDLLLPVRGAAQADAVCALLAAARIERPRLDGELLFEHGAVAWREWSAAAPTPDARVLVKRLREVALLARAAVAGGAAC